MTNHSANFSAGKRKIPVLWDGGNALAVFKPPGLATQAPQGVESLESTLRHQFAERTDYLALPHRLDRPVGGIVLVALTKKVARLLSEQFAARKVKKTYVAVTTKQSIVSPEPWVDQIRKCVGEPRSEVVPIADANTREAFTKVVSVRHRPETTLLVLSPRTGRMHQLRVQAASRGLTIVGDVLYGCEASAEVLRDTLGPWAPRDAIALAASELEFHDPNNGMLKNVSCPTEHLHFNM